MSASGVTVSQLQKGDIIASTTSDFASGVIRKFTHSKYSHMGLYYGNGMVIEAIVSGVVMQSVAKSVGKAMRRDVYRCNGITPTQASAIVSYAHTLVGRNYDPKGAIHSQVYGMPTDSGDYFCSQLVIESCQKGGVFYDLGTDMVYTPGVIETLFNDGRVARLGHLTM
ncbi:MAG TPA: YiiX/YebB-like N1pC/P60 family cysteine hydrolase [Gemmatales bacterium]|nr:YiiX/YebB-like N1pC/P60 family cysteine hydrolase [Gemmatales bacterium]